MAVEDLFSPKVAIPSWATPETISQYSAVWQFFSKRHNFSSKQISKHFIFITEEKQNNSLLIITNKLDVSNNKLAFLITC